MVRHLAQLLTDADAAGLADTVGYGGCGMSEFGVRWRSRVFTLEHNTGQDNNMIHTYIC